MAYGRVNVGGLGGGSAGKPVKVTFSETAPTNPEKYDIWVETDIQPNKVYFQNEEPQTPKTNDFWCKYANPLFIADNLEARRIAFKVPETEYFGGVGNRVRIWGNGINLYASIGRLKRWNGSEWIWHKSHWWDGNNWILHSFNDFYVYVGLSINTLYKLDPMGDLVWESPTSNRPYSIKVGQERNVYVGTTNSGLVKFNKDGEQIWRYTVSSTVRIVDVVVFDADDSIYGLGNNGYIAKHDDHTGDRIWYKTFRSNDGNSMTRDHYGHLYVAYNTSTNNIQKIDPVSESLIWQITGESAVANSVATHPEDYLYVGFNSGHLRKINFDGEIIWRVNLPVTSTTHIRAVCVDYNHVYAGCSNGKIYKLDLEGNIIWETQPAGGTVASLSVDPDGYLYGLYMSNGTVFKIDQDGDVLWDFVEEDYESIWGDALAVEPGPYGEYPYLW